MNDLTDDKEFAKNHPCLGHQLTGERFECIDCGREDRIEFYYLDDRCIACHHQADRRLIAKLRAEVLSFESEWKREQQMRIDAEDEVKRLLRFDRGEFGGIKCSCTYNFDCGCAK